MKMRKSRFVYVLLVWFARASDRVTCFLRGHTPRRRTGYVFCGTCGYLHQRNEEA